MRIVVPVAASIVLLALAAFCLFGFLAKFEPNDTLGLFWALRIVYVVVGIGCVVGVVALISEAVGK